MSKCEYINLLNEATFNTDEMFEALELLEDNCAKCENPVCEPEEIKDVEALCDVIDELGSEEDFDGCSCDDKEETDAESLVVLQEVEKENIRMAALYDNEFEVEDTELNLKSQREAEALGVFFRTLVAAGLSTAEAYNLTLNKMSIDNNIEVAKVGQVANMQNQI